MEESTDEEIRYLKLWQGARERLEAYDSGIRSGRIDDWTDANSYAQTTIDAFVSQTLLETYDVDNGTGVPSRTFMLNLKLAIEQFSMVSDSTRSKLNELVDRRGKMHTKGILTMCFLVLQYPAENTPVFFSSYFFAMLLSQNQDAFNRVVTKAPQIFGNYLKEEHANSTYPGVIHLWIQLAHSNLDETTKKAALLYFNRCTVEVARDFVETFRRNGVDASIRQLAELGRSIGSKDSPATAVYTFLLRF